MKKIISLLVLICSVAVIIVSCAKKEEESTTAAAAGTGSGTTASGTISGIDNLTGTFHLSWVGGEPSGGCISNSYAVAGMIALALLPSGTLGFKMDIIITSSTSWTKSIQYYSDASCATVTGYMNLLYKDFLVGDILSDLSPGSDPAKPTTAKKVSYAKESLALNSNTDTATSFFNTTLGASTLSALGFTQGTELVVPSSGNEVNIWETGPASWSSKTYFYEGDSHESTYPDNWTSASVYWQE